MCRKSLLLRSCGPRQRSTSEVLGVPSRPLPRAAELVEIANLESALPVQPRLKDAELPLTTNQLRQAAVSIVGTDHEPSRAACAPHIRSMLRPIGPVVVFGPDNFPFAFNSATGGDFAAAVAAGNPVIASHHDRARSNEFALHRGGS